MCVCVRVRFDVIVSKNEKLVKTLTKNKCPMHGHSL